MTHTVVGIFDNQEDARDAMKELLNQGFIQKDIDFSRPSNLNDTAALKAAGKDEGIGDKISDFFGNLFNDNNERANNYSSVARETEAVLTVLADSDERAELAADILDDNGAVNVNERAAQYRQQRAQNTEVENTQDDMTIPVVEENLEVGKRTVETGGVRVRSQIIEKPIEETLRLREEHIVVDRHPVNREATDADFNNLQGDIELTEHAERAVVSKEARVVEEIEIGKTVDTREETVRDKVRRTEVDVDEIDGDVEARKASNRT
jgi:uncharacterized protein (TIGR02271 family)